MRDNRGVPGGIRDNGGGPGGCFRVIGMLDNEGDPSCDGQGGPGG